MLGGWKNEWRAVHMQGSTLELEGMWLSLRTLRARCVKIPTSLLMPFLWLREACPPPSNS